MTVWVCRSTDGFKLREFKTQDEAIEWGAQYPLAIDIMPEYRPGWFARFVHSDAFILSIGGLIILCSMLLGVVLQIVTMDRAFGVPLVSLKWLILTLIGQLILTFAIKFAEAVIKRIWS